MRLNDLLAHIQLYLDDIETHVDDMLSAGAVVSGSGVALEGITEVTAVQVVVPQVIVASPEEGQQKGRFIGGYRSFFLFFFPLSTVLKSSHLDLLGVL